MVRSYGSGGMILPRPARFLAFSHREGDNSTRASGEVGLHRNGSMTASSKICRGRMARDEGRNEPWSAPWLGPVRRRVRRWCAGGVGQSWVVAVSGGSDSVGLLRVLHTLAPELGLSLSVAHLDH